MASQLRTIGSPTGGPVQEFRSGLVRAVVWLDLMHLAVAIPIVGGHARRLPAARVEARS